jgi:uncharacterized protein (TIGR02246 family)
MKIIYFSVFLLFAFLPSAWTVQVECTYLTDAQVTGLFDLWNDALATKNSQTVTNRYTDDAVLLATVSDLPRNTPALIKDYFDEFLLKEPQGVILYSDPVPGCNQATDMGLYVFTFKDGSKVKARYTYFYVYDSDEDEWYISHHHSSMLPEQFLDEEGPDVIVVDQDLSGGSLKFAFSTLLALFAFFII